ncbi:hypothetical protein MnTg04_01151 [bacterium MnTg04]|nr:hypothetical protein MnTg04_01151 [bacterium MnTg04]
MRHLWNLLFTRKVPSSRLCVFLSFDDKAGVWFVSKSDVPGLNAESASQDELIAIVRQLVPELLKLNERRDDGFAPEGLVVRSQIQLPLAS